MNTCETLFELDTRDLRQEEFDAYDRANPQVWDAFHVLAYRRAKAGKARLSAKHLFEILRDDWEFSGEGGKRMFKLNNIWTPFYARKFMQRYPQYEGIFETRGKE